MGAENDAEHPEPPERPAHPEPPERPEPPEPSAPPEPPEHPELGAYHRTYRPMRRKPSAYALLLLFLTPFAALTYLLALLVGAVVGRGWDLAPVVLGGLALLGPFAVRVLWYRRHTRVEFRHYEEGLVAVTAAWPGSALPLAVDGGLHGRLGPLQTVHPRGHGRHAGADGPQTRARRGGDQGPAAPAR